VALDISLGIVEGHTSARDKPHDLVAVGAQARRRLATHVDQDGRESVMSAKTPISSALHR
jgi:hypothetical protein